MLIKNQCKLRAVFYKQHDEKKYLNEKNARLKLTVLTNE
jgi:hypothetical protein